MILDENIFVTEEKIGENNERIGYIIPQTVEYRFKDGRCVELVWLDINPNLEMLKQGYAWYNPFDGENPDYQKAEREAKAAKRGLWADKHAVALWEWRKEKKK